MSQLSAWIGRPYRDDATGPEAFDCRGLATAVQLALWGRRMPALHGGLADVLRGAVRDGWQPTDEPPAAGDVLLVHTHTGPHVGVFVLVDGRVRVLHARSAMVDGRQRGSVRLDRLEDLLGAGYRHPQVWRHTA